MAEKRDSWFVRWLASNSSPARGSSQDSHELEADSIPVDLAHTELEKQRDLAQLRGLELGLLRAQTSAHELAMNEARAALDESADNLARLATELSELRARHEQELVEAKQGIVLAFEDAQTSRRELDHERTKARAAASQAHDAQRRVEQLQEQAKGREHTLTELQEAHANTLLKNDALEEKLSLSEYQTRSALENAASDHAALLSARELLTSLRAEKQHVDQALSELKHDAELTQATSSGLATELTRRIVLMNTTREQALLEERQRWLMLVSRFWKALGRALGPAASVPLARELEGESVLGVLAHATTPEGAAEGLGQALRELSLCDEISVSCQLGELELRLREPFSASGSAGSQGWVGVFAVQCLGSMLGRSLQTYAIDSQDGELVVHARFLHGSHGEAASGAA